MRYCTTKYFEARQDHFVCVNYRSNTGSCSAHFIRAVVLEQMIWEHMREVIWYAGHYESFAMMSRGYEDEQCQLKAEAEALRGP